MSGNRKLVFLILMLAAICFRADAQTPGNIGFGAPASSSQMNSLLGGKADVNNGTLNNPTVTGTVGGAPSIPNIGITGGTQTGANVSANNVTATNGATNPLSTWTAGWNVVVPTNSSADVTNVQRAVNGTQPVLLAAGTFQICSQITVPVNQRVEGMGGDSNSGSSGASSNMSRTVVSCPTNGSFTTGQAFFALQDHDVFRGIDIYCNFGSSPVYNGINALNALAPEIDHNTVAFCKNGISRFSDSAHPGATISFSQLGRIHDNFLYENTGYGYLADFANSGFVSDEEIGPNNDFVLASGSTGGIYLHFVASVQVFDNRIEVGGNGFAGIDIEQGGKITIVDNNCEQVQCLKINGASTVTVTGNYGNSNSFGALYNVEFAGTNTGLLFAGNTWTGASILYKVDAGGTLPFSTFAENANFPTTIFNDSYTQTVMQPLMVANYSQVSTIPQDYNVLSTVAGNHLSSRGFTPTLSSCGTSPSVTGDDNAGTISTGTGSPTACTATFASVYTSTPQCTVNTGTTSSVADISAISTTAFTVTLSATAAKLYYHCVETIQNLVASSPNMTTSGWSAFNSTLTTGVATGPDGATDAAAITESSAFNRMQQGFAVVGSSGSNTMSVYIHTGSTGSDNITLTAYDSAFTNTAGAIFQTSNGAFLGTQQMAGNGSVTGVGSQSMGNGWTRVWMTFTVGTTVAWYEVGLAQGTSIFITGNSSNNVYIWGPALRAGSLP